MAYRVDGTAPQTTAAGRLVVPAAGGGAPATLVLFVVRPRAGLPGRIPLTGWNGLQYVQDIGQEGTLAETLQHSSNPAWGPCEYYNGQNWVCSPVYTYNWTHYTRTLTAAADGLVGTLQLQSFGVNGGGAEIGEGQTIPGGSIDLTRTITH